MNPQRLLAPLTPLYALGLALKNRRYDGYKNGQKDSATVQRLAWPVISVGNLSVGGAGKTPVVMRLVELLREEGMHADVLSRGYGRRSQGVARVPSADAAGNAEDHLAAQYGDEPVLIAATTHAPVYVGASRYEAGQLAEREAAFAHEEPGSARAVHILDDGFQHRQLARDLDIVVLHASDFHEWLLPAGRLREPLRALRRADVLVLREEDSDLDSDLAARLDALDLQQPRWLVRRSLQMPAGLPAQTPVLAFCGIARPREFFAALTAQGANLVAQAAFRDHRAFTAADLDYLLALARKHQVQAFVTTEKDAIRLTAAQRARLSRAAPVLTAPLTVQFLEESAVRAQLLAAVCRQ
ncbi:MULTISPECIES: tetraacyldisaccharide 4'-kinase [Acidobacterium]|uniref:Tetraacyldisaccharide 4'-kinase n=1 Tax=Acidobacterium capsulatum (strain ATCC 51196 / DSM 11244 / BCRC 80197 / JCM 7670 / NBRC 15755 / NCIMB 13165 / 161) TaxID=240015 RepID=C1F753_ACIC5|nr:MULTISPECIES: tetraacyldisaccharide 4'-kinase [Acidobacterium]ACO33998.1 tetraacyldisaccharide 4'-kinase [Acidobacterium capsulatum ATCC 51196]HCT60988.1 tetraacyldisaccharide 4'-kinase [Acidobacterium sp.]